MASSPSKLENLEIKEMQVIPCTNSPYIQSSRVTFKQNENNRIWDYIRVHDGVYILLYNINRQAFVLVKQFRPALYMTINREQHVKQSDDLHKETAHKIDSSIPHTAPPTCGISYELCAGIVDKQTSLAEIAREEVLEECGYNVPLGDIKRVTAWRGELGIACNKQTLFYAEVTDAMLVSGAGGGNVQEGEEIELFYLPVNELKSFMYNEDLAKESSVMFALLWWKDNVQKA